MRKKKNNKVILHKDIVFKPGLYLVSNDVGYVQGPCQLETPADVFEMFDAIENDDVFTFYPVDKASIMVGRVNQHVVIEG
jgi:hypothetical protein